MLCTFSFLSLELRDKLFRVKEVGVYWGALRKFLVSRFDHPYPEITVTRSCLPRGIFTCYGRFIDISPSLFRVWFGDAGELDGQAHVRVF